MQSRGLEDCHISNGGNSGRKNYKNGIRALLSSDYVAWNKAKRADCVDFEILSKLSEGRVLVIRLEGREIADRVSICRYCGG